ncbi:MAG: dCMP deaminase family protein [Candidatus Moranbacteria bacterium]|nr:dCMP deaminase family protein [Candidatus Moranbacteria bacterium]
MENDKRQGYFDWDETFMQMCKVIANRSKDPSTQNGACLVNEKNIIIGLGYNGFPRGCGDGELPWAREGAFCDKKYAYVVHAEENAIYNANAVTEGSKIYCTLFPCNECAKTLIQNGITEVIYEDDKYHDDDIWKASRRMLDLAGVTYRQYVPKNKLIFEKK